MDGNTSYPLSLLEVLSHSEWSKIKWQQVCSFPHHLRLFFFFSFLDVLIPVHYNLKVLSDAVHVTCNIFPVILDRARLNLIVVIHC